MPASPRFCQRCAEQILPERVEALPDTRVCIRCSQEIGGEFVVTVSPDNVGKAGSLKKNYGSWSIQKVRRRIIPRS